MIVAGVALATGVPSPVAIAPDEIDAAPKPSDEIAKDGRRHGGDSVARHR
jgi:hypothetical protein